MSPSKEQYMWLLLEWVQCKFWILLKLVESPCKIYLTDEQTNETFE